MPNSANSPRTKDMRMLQTQLDHAKQRIKTLTAERTALKRQVTAARKDIVRIDKAAAAAVKAAEKTQKELTLAQQRFNLPRATVGALVVLLDRLTREREIIEQGLQDAQANSERRIAECVASVEAVEAKLVNALRENDLLRRDDEGLALINENRKLATLLEILNADLNKTKEVAIDAKQNLEQARQEIEQRLRDELESGFRAEKDRLNAQIQTLTSQVNEQGKTPILSPETTSRLVDDMISKLRNGANGILVRRGELRLKVAFGSTGEHSGFVIPTAESNETVKANLHEVILQFDQANQEE